MRRVPQAEPAAQRRTNTSHTPCGPGPRTQHRRSGRSLRKAAAKGLSRTKMRQTRAFYPERGSDGLPDVHVRVHTAGVEGGDLNPRGAPARRHDTQLHLG